jgi:hypothetical protein
MCREEEKMAIEKTETGAIIITGESIDVYRLLTIRMGLKAEAVGLRLTSKAPSCLSIVKKEFGFKGNLASVTAQFEAMLKANGIVK